MMGFYKNLFTRNKDFKEGTRGEGEVNLIEEHARRKEQYLNMLDNHFDENVRTEREKELEKKSKEKELIEKERKKLLEKEKIEDEIKIPEMKENLDVKEKEILPETVILTQEQKKEIHLQKYLERKRKNNEELPKK